MRQVSTKDLLKISLNQLISRLCHPQSIISTTLAAIVGRVIIDYPHQTLWRLISVSQSSFDRRKERCQRILELAKKKQYPNNEHLSSLIKNCLEIGVLFAELCERPVRLNQNMSMSRHFPQLKRRIQDTNLKLMIPLYSQLYNVNETNHIYFESIEENVTIMQSLQKPKCIQVRGTNGKTYQLLCKAKDDMRIDQRLLEIAEVLNQCLNNESSVYRLYAVTPLNEQCGLIEWMPNQQTLNSAMHYSESDLSKARDLYPPPNSSNQLKLLVFVEKVMPKFRPARLHRWFVQRFPMASKWYAASRMYSKSVAAWSMLGYIVGLGDRHCDNILLDEFTGQCVHVDFNCLFNKGESLPVPEVVPFRLTHNVVDGLGPIGVEGFFRHSCELFMQTMHENRDLLINVFETFVYDPLVEWKRHSKVDTTIQPTRRKKARILNDTSFDSTLDDERKLGEIFNSMAQIQIDSIKNRLNGCVSDKSLESNAIELHSTSLSIEGHVEYLIKKASDNELLSQMYCGWSPHL